MKNTRFHLHSRNALITGSAGLLGREHAFALAEAGANLVLTDIRLEALKGLQSELKENFPEIEVDTFEMDVSSEDSVRGVFNQLKDQNKRVHILVNNAAIDPKVSKDSRSLAEESRLEHFPIESWNFQIAVGLTGAMICSKIFGTEMATQDGGVIVNIASDLSVIAPDQRLYRKPGVEEMMQPAKPITYSVIKHGMIGLTKYLATYWAHQGVRVNALSPGGVQNGQPEEFVSKLTKLIPMGRMAHKNEYRGCLQFLCSDASAYMTGQNLVVDGGRSTW